MAEVLLSFIVPVYNLEKYIEPCIQSVLKTSESCEIEIVAVDDGSKDASGTVLDRLAAQETRLKVIHQANQGVSVARNTGIDACTGKWLTFVDGDDVISGQFVNRMRGFMEHGDQDFIVSSISLFYHEDGSDIRANSSIGREFICEGEDMRVFTLETLCPSFHIQASKFLVEDTRGITACCFRTDVIRREKLRFIPGIVLSQDFLFRFSYMRYVKKALCVSDTTYYYRKFGASSTSTYRENMLEIVDRLCGEYKKIIDELYDGNDEIMKRYYGVIIMQSRRLIMTCLNSPKCPLNHDEKIRAFDRFRHDTVIASGIANCDRAILLPPYNRLLDAWRIPDANKSYHACVQALSSFGRQDGLRARIRKAFKQFGLYDMTRRIYHKFFR